MFKKRYLFLIIIVCFFAISAVSAEDNFTSDIISVSNDVNSLEANIVESNMNSDVNDTDTLKVSNDDVLTSGNNWYVNSSKTSSGDGKSDAGAFVSLREAIHSASNGDTVMIASGEYYGTDNIGLQITNSLNFIKYGDGEAIFDAEHRQIWYVTATYVNINGLTFKNGKSNEGGAIYFYKGGSVTNSTFTGNTAEYNGGAIYFYNNGGSVTNCTFTNNIAKSEYYYEGGAAIFFRSGGSVTNCTFINNTAEYGGAINFNNDGGNVTNCTFINNTARTISGAIFFRSGGNVTNCTFINNTAEYNGGAINFHNNSGSGSVTNCTFINNTAEYGGAINFYNNGGSGSVTNSTFTGNTAKTDGGSIFFTGNGGSVTNCTFTGNTAKTDGGSIYFNSNGGSVTNSTFTGNTASGNGGAINFNNRGRVTNSTFTKNTAFNGGAICFWSGASVTNSAFDNNYGIDYGDAIYSDEVISIENNWWSSNNPNWNKLINNGQIPSVYSILNVIADPTEIYTSEKSTITTKFIWNGSNTDATNLLPKRNVKLSSNGTLTVTEGDVGLTSKFSATTSGIYYVNATVDNQILEVNLKVTVNPEPKENLTISASAQPITVGEDANVVVTGLKNATGEVTVTVNGKTYTAPIKNSKATVNIPGLTESVTGNVNYNGDDKYNPASTTVNITVNPKPKENLTIEATAKPITVGEDANVIVTGLKDATGEVTVTIGSNKWTGKINKGTANVVVTGLKETSTASVNYAGNNKYNPASTTVKITVNPNVIIDAPDVTKYYGGSERFIVTLKDLNGNPIKNAVVKITINSRTSEKVTDDNGIASMGINLNSGEYITTTEYDGIKVNSTVTVKDTVIAKDFTKIFKNGTQYQGTFVDSQGNLIRNTDVQININGVFYTRTTDGNGVAQMNINLNPGTYILTATNPSSGEQHTTKVTVLPNIVENYDLTKFYKNASQYSLRLLDDKGNPVGAGVSIQLNINGVFYTRTSDANGYVKMNINLPPGTYIITAEYKGLRMSNTIKVLTVLEAKDLVMRYHDGSQFKVKVLDGQGRPYAGQTVTYNINGVFYTKTTDGDGIAALTINLPAGEYIITSMYNGLNVANKVTIIG